MQYTGLAKLGILLTLSLKGIGLLQLRKPGVAIYIQDHPIEPQRKIAGHTPLSTDLADRRWGHDFPGLVLLQLSSLLQCLTVIKPIRGQRAKKPWVQSL